MPGLRKLCRVSEFKPPHGRRLRGHWGDGSPKFEVGDGPCFRLPIILRTTVIGGKAKYKLTENRFSEGIWGGELEVCSQKMVN